MTKKKLFNMIMELAEDNLFDAKLLMKITSRIQALEEEMKSLDTHITMIYNMMLKNKK